MTNVRARSTDGWWSREEAQPMQATSRIVRMTIAAATFALLTPISAFAAAPTADPGGPYNPECASPTVISLDGSASTDLPDGNTVDTWEWQNVSCPGTTFNDASLESPTLTIVPTSCGFTCRVRLRVTDDNFEVSAWQGVNITIDDTTDPALVGVPADSTVQCDAVPAAATVTSTDNCFAGPVVLSESDTQVMDGSCNQYQYTITRQWDTMDACTNTDQLIETIEVIDTVGPTLVGVPADVTVECDSIPVAATVTATDTCDTAPTVALAVASTPGSCTHGYSIKRTWTATDACGNDTVGIQTITVVDTTAPVLSAPPADVTVSCDSIPPASLIPATDNCDTTPTVTVATSVTRGACPLEGVLVRTWTAVDDCGNKSSVSQTITVVDDAAPTFDVATPADVTVECDAVPAPMRLAISDNCDPAPVLAFAETRIDGGCANEYTLKRTWTATDACGNETMITQLVTVEDTTDPVLVGVPADTSSECDSIPPPPRVTGTDNCGRVIVTMKEVESNFQCATAYSLDRTWTATDECGNTSSATQHIDILDSTGPVLTGVPLNTTAECSGVPSAPRVAAKDACEGVLTVRTSETRTDGSCADEYVLTRKWGATDDCGNSTVATKTVSVSDNTDPAISKVPRDVTVGCNDVPPVGTPRAYDNCDASPDLTVRDIRTNYGDTHEIERRWTLVDNCGNEVDASQFIYVRHCGEVTLDFPGTTVSLQPIGPDSKPGIPMLAPPKAPLSLWTVLNNTSWSLTHPQTAVRMATGDIDDSGIHDLMVDFGNDGIWGLFDYSKWAIIHPLSSEGMETGDINGGGDDLVLDFGPTYGTWVLYNNAGWGQLHPLSPQQFVIGDFDDSGQDDIAFDFGATFGLWILFDNSTWFQAHTFDAETMAVGNLDGAGREELIVDFGPLGFLVLTSTGWETLPVGNPVHFATGDLDGSGEDDLIVDFGAVGGVWVYYNNADWLFLHPLTSEQVVTTDMDGSGEDEAIFDFGPIFGTWVLYNNTTWTKLHPSSPDDMVAHDLDGE